VFLFRCEDEGELLFVSKREAMARMGSMKQRTEKGKMEKSFLIYVQKLLRCGVFND
jgi:hypothetical protein